MKNKCSTCSSRFTTPKGACSACEWIESASYDLDAIADLREVYDAVASNRKTSKGTRARICASIDRAIDALELHAMVSQGSAYYASNGYYPDPYTEDEKAKA